MSNTRRWRCSDTDEPLGPVPTITVAVDEQQRDPDVPHYIRAWSANVSVPVQASSPKSLSINTNAKRRAALLLPHTRPDTWSRYTTTLSLWRISGLSRSTQLALATAVTTTRLRSALPSGGNSSQSRISMRIK